MMTIRCTRSEQQKLQDPRNMVICYIINALGGCEDGHCPECRQHQDEVVTWEITDEVSV